MHTRTCAYIGAEESETRLTGSAAATVAAAAASGPMPCSPLVRPAVAALARPVNTKKHNARFLVYNIDECYTVQI